MAVYPTLAQAPWQSLETTEVRLAQYYGMYSSSSKEKANKDGSLARFTYRPKTA